MSDYATSQLFSHLHIVDILVVDCELILSFHSTVLDACDVLNSRCVQHYGLVHFSSVSYFSVSFRGVRYRFT